MPAYQRPHDTLPTHTQAPNEEIHYSSALSSLPNPERLELIGSSAEGHGQVPPACGDRVVDAQGPSTADQTLLEYEVDIVEVVEMAASNTADARRIANTSGDGIDLVEWGSGRAEHRPRWGGDFFHPGRVVNPFSGSNDELDRRTLVVLSTTNNGYAECLALCRHPDHSGEERASFYRAHAAVYCSGEPPPSGGGKGANEAVEIKFKSARFKLQDSCYVNFEHTWTIRPDFPVMDLGYVRKDQRRKLMEMHVKVQTDLFNRNIEEHGLGEKLTSLWA